MTKTSSKPSTDRKTQIRRETVLQEARIVVEAAPYARMVQLWAPNSPEVLVAVDMLPEEIGLDRVYKMAVLPPAGFPRFRLEPNQFIVAAAQNGLANLTVIEELAHG